MNDISSVTLFHLLVSVIPLNIESDLVDGGEEPLQSSLRHRLIRGIVLPVVADLETSGQDIVGAASSVRATERRVRGGKLTGVIDELEGEGIEILALGENNSDGRKDPSKLTSLEVGWRQNSDIYGAKFALVGWWDRDPRMWLAICGNILEKAVNTFSNCEVAISGLIDVCRSDAFPSQKPVPSLSSWTYDDRLTIFGPYGKVLIAPKAAARLPEPGALPAFRDEWLGGHRLVQLSADISDIDANISEEWSSYFDR